MSAFLRNIGKTSLAESASLYAVRGRRKAGGKYLRHIGPLRPSVSSGGGFALFTVHSFIDTDSITDFTFSTQSVGATSSSGKSRTHVAVFARTSTSLVTTISSVTIGGNAASLITNTDDTSTFEDWGLYVYALTTGTTADIVVTTAASAANMLCEIVVFALYGADITSPSAQAANAASADNVSASVTIPAGGFAIAYSWSGGSGALTATWNVGTEDLDTTTNEAFFTINNTASHTTSTSGATTITCTYSASSGRLGISAAAFGSA